MGTLFWFSYALLWGILVIQGLAFLEVLRQVGQLRRHLPRQGALLLEDAIEPGRQLPAVRVKSLIDLRDVGWDDYLDRDWGVVLFLSTDCITCRIVAEGVSRTLRVLPTTARLFVLFDSPLEEVRQFISETRLPAEFAAIDEPGSTEKLLGVAWTPAVLLVKGREVVEVGIVNSPDQLEALIDDVVIHDRKVRDGITSQVGRPSR